MGRIVEALSKTRGAYSLLFLTLDKMIAARDPYGFRPLVMGQFADGKNRGAYVFASETCALDLIEANYVRDVEPGEIITVGPDGVESLKPFPPAPHAKCIFEYVYFARPDSNLFGHNVYRVRKASAASWRGRAVCRRIWSRRCRTPVCRPQWDMRKSRGFLSSSA